MGSDDAPFTFDAYEKMKKFLGVKASSFAGFFNFEVSKACLVRGLAGNQHCMQGVEGLMTKD